MPLLRTPCPNFGSLGFALCRCMLRKEKKTSLLVSWNKFQNWQIFHNFCKTIFLLQKFTICNVRSLGRVSEVRACYPTWILLCEQLSNTVLVRSIHIIFDIKHKFVIVQCKVWCNQMGTVFFWYGVFVSFKMTYRDKYSLLDHYMKRKYFWIFFICIFGSYHEDVTF